MKNSNGKSFLVVIAFLAISLMAANVFIVNSDFKGDFQPNIVKSILNYAKNENTFAGISDVKTAANGSADSSKNVDVPDDKQTGAVKEGSSGKILIERTSRRVLAGEGIHEKCYPASTTKILTAYVVLKNLPLDHVVTVPKQAEGVEGSSIYLKAGEQATVEDLLYGLMLRSGNDAATALALEVGGSVERFAAMMNETATQLGAKNSHFANPHGLHDEEHFTTPYDLAMITAAAYELDDFRRIVSTTLRRVELGETTTAIANKNKLLKMYDGANGVKTGYTKKSGRCLVGGAERDGMQLISVVLNCPDMWNESVRLLNYGFENFNMIPLDHALLRQAEGGRPVQIVAPYSVTSDWRDVLYPLADDEYPVVNAA